VWLAAWPYIEFTKAIGEILGAPESAVPITMLAVGVPEGITAKVDRFEPDWVYSEQYGQRDPGTHA
jgi:hypothetical protein